MKITIKDIAMESGFSTATVSKILNKKDSDISESTRNIVLSVAKKHNFQLNRAASSLVSKITKTIGLLLPDISNPFFSDIARGAEDYAYSNGYSIFLCNSYESMEKETNYLKSMIQLNVDGILLVGNISQCKNDLSNYKFQQPMVSIDRSSVYSSVFSMIQTNHYEGAKEAMEYLISKGHSKIFFMAGPKESNSSIQRYNAYINTMKSHGLKTNSKDVIFGDFSFEHGYKDTKSLEYIKNYTAIFCCNDLIALGCMTALKELDIKVPNDISVMGIDDIDLAKIFSPSLTTMKQPAYKLGYESCKVLINKLQNINSPERITLKQELVERESVISLH